MDGEQIVHDVAERVRQIVTEAEEKAAEIVRNAEADAKRIREQAEEQGKQRLEEVRQALDELQGKLGGGASAATKPHTPSSEIDPGPVVVPEPEPPAVPEPEPPPGEPIVPPAEPEPEPAIVPEPAPPPDEGDLPSAVNGSRSTDDAAARLVAMNLALEGVSIEQAKERLAADYDLADLDALVEEIFARAAK